MQTLIRLALFVIFLLFSQIQVAETLHDRGIQLCTLRNLPHRGLGMLYSACLLMPEREDWLLDYLSEWAIVQDENRMFEPTTRRTMAAESIRISKSLPSSRQARIVNGFVKQLDRQNSELGLCWKETEKEKEAPKGEDPDAIPPK